MNWEVPVTSAVVLVAAAEDLWHRQISNWIPLTAFAAGVAIQAATGGWRGVGSALLGSVCGFLVFFLFYFLGGMGGGDVKLMAGVGALLGPPLLLKAALWTAAAGGVWALSVAGYRRLALRFQSGARDAGGIWDKPIAYAPAIGIGVMLALVERW